MHPALHWKPPVSDWDPIKPSNSVSIKKSSETVPPIEPESQHICISAIVLTSKHLKISKNVGSVKAHLVAKKRLRGNLKNKKNLKKRICRTTHPKWAALSRAVCLLTNVDSSKVFFYQSTPRSRNHEVCTIHTENSPKAHFQKS